MVLDIEIQSNTNIKITHGAFGLHSELSERLCDKLAPKLLQYKRDNIELQNIISTINFIAAKDIKTAEHCIRVGLLSERIAIEINRSPKPLLYAGITHDTGKVKVSREILQKKRDFGEKDIAVMRDHPLDTLKLVGDIFPYSANVGARHHKHQKDGYPDNFPQTNDAFSEDTNKKIDDDSKIVTLADQYDAAVSRVDKNPNRSQSKSLIEIVTKIKGHFPEHKDLIEKLYKNMIFHEHLKLVRLCSQHYCNCLILSK